jgi:hypothetical protein
MIWPIQNSTHSDIPTRNNGDAGNDNYDGSDDGSIATMKQRKRSFVRPVSVLSPNNNTYPIVPASIRSFRFFLFV